MMAYYWKPLKDENKYVLQFDDVPKSSINVLKRKLKKQWHCFGIGEDIKGKFILLFSSNLSKYKLKKWIKENKEWQFEEIKERKNRRKRA